MQRREPSFHSANQRGTIELPNGIFLLRYKP